VILGFQASDMGPDELFTAYLDDTLWTWDAHAFAPDTGVLSLCGQRIVFETPTLRQAFGFLPVTECAVVPAMLLVTNVRTATFQPERTHGRQGLRFELAELADLRLTLWFDGGEIRAALASWAPLILRDTGPPVPRMKHRYWGRRFRDALRGVADEANLRRIAD
jgi:hypothetical protein